MVSFGESDVISGEGGLFLCRADMHLVTIHIPDGRST